MANIGGWKRVMAGYYVYRNSSGVALAYVERYRGAWKSEIRRGSAPCFSSTGVRARTLAEAKSETESLYRAQRS